MNLGRILARAGVLGGLMAFLGLGATSPAQALGLITVGGETIETVGSDDRLCDYDDECEVQRLRRVTGPAIRLSNRNGAILGDGGATPASSLDLDFATVMPVGTIHAELSAYVLSDGPERLQASFGELDSLFLCTKPDGAVAWPIVGAFEARCRPDAALGVGLALPKIQYDSGSHRLVGRWVSLTGVYNFLQNGHGRGYLRRNLKLIFGADVETIWFGDLKPDPREVNIRGIVGLSGAYRTPSAGWEVTASVLGRPILAGDGPFGQWVAEGSLAVSKHFLLSQYFRGVVGLNASASWAENPHHHPGAFADFSSKASTFVGVHLGVSYDILLQ